MGFTRLDSSGVVATKGRWAAMYSGALLASISAQAKQGALSAPRSAGSANGKAALAKNKETLAKALANIPVSRAPHASIPRVTPANTTANKARLDALLADKD
jgi:hypothetical protein